MSERRTAILTTADGEAEYEPTAPYVLSKPDEDWCYAIVRTADGEVLGTDGWQQMGVVEDASFQRDLAWILPELNRLAGEVDRLREAAAAVAGPLLDHWAECPAPPDAGCADCHAWWTARRALIPLDSGRTTPAGAT